jgi:cohesin complex subunit SA-1/2
MKRYKDSDMYIRADSLNALSRYTLIRPDIFIVGLYLKYFGWMLSDKDAVVRKAAVSGLLMPFRQAKNGGKGVSGIKIDTSAMDSVIDKFHERLADMVLDADLSVAEVTMELLLVLLRKSFFDELENDAVWQQINMRALDPQTTPAVRRDALYFVFEQLEAFDTASSNSENDAVERIKALANW